MNGPLASRTSPFDYRSIALAVTLAILIPIAPHEASAKGGTFYLWSAWAHVTTVSPSGATTVSRPAATTAVFGVFGGCGGKRYRDPNTHRCRSPADFGH
jgi:hypothetical protein